MKFYRQWVVRVVIVMVMESFVLTVPKISFAQQQEGHLVESITSGQKDLIVQEMLNQFENVTEPETNAEFQDPVSFPSDQEILEGSQEEAKPSYNEIQPIILDILDFDETDIQIALRIIERKAGLDILIEPDVQGEISVDLKNINVWNALKVILESRDLAYKVENGVVKVMTADAFEKQYNYKFNSNLQSRFVPIRHADIDQMARDLRNTQSPNGQIFVSQRTKELILLDYPEYLNKMIELIKKVDIPLETKIFQLTYITADDVHDTVEKVLTENIGYAAYDKKANKIIVTDVPEKIEQIKQIVWKADKKVEVQLATKIIQVTLNEEQIKGIDWEAIVSDYNSLGLSEDQAIKDIRKLSAGILSHEDFPVLLEALQTVGRVKSFPGPNISTASDQKIYLHLRSNVDEAFLTMVSAKSEPVPGGEPQQPFKLQKIFYVIPHLFKKGELNNVLPDASDETSMSITIIPEEDDAQSRIALKTKKDTIVVIGGIFMDERIQSTKKVPLLGDLPFLGSAFRNQETALQRKENIIFLMPKILVTYAHADDKKTAVSDKKM